MTGFGIGALGVAPLGAEDDSFDGIYIVEAIMVRDPIFADQMMVILSEIQAGDTVTPEQIMVVLSRMNFSDTVSPLATLLMTLNDSVAARDLFTALFEIAIQDGFAATDLATFNATAILALADQLSMQDSQIDTYIGVTTIVSALVLADTLKFQAEQLLTDSVNFADLITSQQDMMLQIIETVMLQDDIDTDGSLVILATVNETFAIGDSIEGGLALLMELLDTFGAQVRVSIPGEGGHFIGYTVNIKNGAVAELSNFPFKSMTTAGSLTLLAASGGIYMLGGPDDAGTPIDASVYTGLSDFGTTQLKKVPNGYLGLTGDGQMRMAVITTDGGKKKENWYALRVNATAPVEGRLDFAKGLVARYWGFRIENIAGSDFMLDMVKVWPMLIQRRKSGR